MKTRWILGLVVVLALSLAASADTFNLTYTPVTGGPSFGVGQVTINPAALVPFNSDFTNNPGSILSAFSVTFDNFPLNGPLTFGLSDLGAVFLTTDGAGNITDLNFWTYDRFAVGGNTCPLCTVPYMAGVADFTTTVTDPVNNNTMITYDLSLTAVPEPASMLLFGSGLLGIAGTLKRRIIG